MGGALIRSPVFEKGALLCMSPCTCIKKDVFYTHAANMYRNPVFLYASGFVQKQKIGRGNYYVNQALSAILLGQTEARP